MPPDEHAPHDLARSGAASGAGTVAALWRYPVKSLVGEELSSVEVDERGVRGDRLWALRDVDGKLGSGKSTTRFRRMQGLLGLRATYDEDVPVVLFPDGRAVRGSEEAIDEALTSYVGRRVSLAREAEVPHHDDGPIHLVTTASLRWAARVHGGPVDPRRLRPNVVLRTDGEELLEERWIGQRLALGDEVVVEVLGAMPRCVMVDLDQHDLPVTGGLLKELTARNDGCLGVLARVERPGRVRLGDPAGVAE